MLIMQETFLSEGFGTQCVQRMKSSSDVTSQREDRDDRIVLNLDRILPQNSPDRATYTTPTPGRLSEAVILLVRFYWAAIR